MSNNNFKLVHIKSDRTCKLCNKVITKNSMSLTVNPRFGKRQWYCMICVEKMKELQRAKARLNQVAFGDEGMVLACMDLVDECESELIRN